MVLAILKELAVVEIENESSDLFVTYTSNKGPFIVTLPQIAAEVLIEEGGLQISTATKEGE